MKYREKPRVVEAVRYMIDEVYPDWFIDMVKTRTIILYDDGSVSCNTDGMWLGAAYGDYIVLGKSGAPVPIMKKNFEESREPINEE